MKLRDLICELMDCGIDDLDAEVIAFHEEEIINEISTGEYAAIQDDFIQISKNGDCVQLFLYNRSKQEVKQ